MDRVLAIVRLRLTLRWRAVQGGIGALRLVAGAIGVALGALLALALAVGFGFWIHGAIAAREPASIRLGHLVAFYAFAVMALGLPLLPGMAETSFDVSRLRPFPIARRHLFAIHLAACFGNGEHLLYYPAVVAVLLVSVPALGWSAAAAAALLVLFVATLVAWNNALLLFLAAVLRARRLREILGFLTLLVVVLLSFAPLTLQLHGEKDVPRLVALAAGPAAAVARALPPALAAEGLTALHTGAGARTARSFAALALWAAAGVALGYRVFLRHHTGLRKAAGGSAGRQLARRPAGAAARPGFDLPALGFLPAEVRAVAAKDLLYLLRSLAGRFMLLVFPLFVILIAGAFADELKRPFFGVSPDNLVLLGLLFYSTLFSNNMVNNAYAWEGDGVQAYFFLPVEPRRVVAGKNLAVWLYNAILLVLCLGIWSVLVRPPDARTLTTALLVFAVSLLTFTTCGNVISILFPVRRDMSSITNAPSQVAVLLAMVVMVGIGGLLALFLFLPQALGLPGGQPISLALLFLAVAGAYGFVLRFAGDLLGQRRDRLVTSLRAER